MGYGAYTHEAHEAITRSREKLPQQEVFKQRTCHPLMNPFGVKLRECRDSPDHPESLGICFALDVSGSMGQIPEQLARRELPRFMKTLLETGTLHPQVLFMAFADARYDVTPLQVGQFESTAELMDQWLTLTCMEAVVRGTSYTGKLQGGESYELALWFAARHTAMDCVEKRQKKGYLFMTGDETGYPAVPAETVKITLGYDVDADIPMAAVMAAVRESWHPFFIIPDHGRRGVEGAWREHFGNDVIVMASPEDTCAVTAAVVSLREGTLANLDDVGRALRDGGMAPGRVEASVDALRPWVDGRATRS